jgi:7-cyano-7-deazaguanine synthase in queuosine biosynthesis
MVTNYVVATPDAERAKAAHGPSLDRIGIALYHVGRDNQPGVGHTLPHVVKRLPKPPTRAAWDFLSFALAVFATDKFVLRERAEDCWTRVIDLEVAVVDPAPWQAQADRIARALRFLTGDIWAIHFIAGGAPPPTFQPQLTDRDAVCLFSGGLDSLLGAMRLVQEGRRPILVSQASPKEGPPQKYLAERLGLADHRFEGKATERWRKPYELSSRARSILFIAYGVAAAGGLTPTLIIPENGLISLNPPLTLRRLGSLSTRTTHPHYISELNSILANAGIDVTLENPFGLATKGEMLAACKHPAIAKFAPLSYSCGKGKRKNQQCGQCVPCLIRRASFLRAGMKDTTGYYVEHLAKASKNDDVQAARLAVERLKSRNIDRWAAEGGPLPEDPALRAQYVDVVRRGLGELGDLLGAIAWP